MTEPKLGSIPLPIASGNEGDEGSSKKSAKEMLKKALEDHGASLNKDSGSNSSSDPSSGSSNIVDMLFKDFITKKITPPGGASSAPAANTFSVEKSKGEINAMFKKVRGSRSSMNEINQLLDLEISSMNIKPATHHGDKPEGEGEGRGKHSRSSSSVSSSKSKSYDSTSKSIINTQPLLSDTNNKGGIPFRMQETQISSVPQMVPPPPPLSTVPLLQSAQPKPTQHPPNQPPVPTDTPLEFSLPMLPPTKKAVKVAPKMLPLKLSEVSLSLIKEKEEEEGEVFSSSSESSIKDDNSSSSGEGEIVSDEEALQGKAWRSKHKKSKHKHKKKKKKKKSKSKDKSKERKSETKSSKSSTTTTTTSSDDKRFADLGTRTIINDAALAKDGAEGSEESLGKSEDSNRPRSKSTEDKQGEVLEKKRLENEDAKKHDKKKKLENEDDKDKKHEKKKKKRSRSRSKSRSPKKSKRSRSRSPKKSKRSRSRSPKKSKSRSSKSKSPKRSKHSRSRSRSPRRSKRSRSRSPKRSKRSRSRSPKRSKRSRSRSPRRSRRSRSRSPRRDKDGYKFSRDKDRKTTKEKSDHDLRVKIDKVKLRKIAMANALKNMTAGQGPEVSIVSRAGGKSVDELTNFCKKISDREKNDSEVSESEEEVMEEQEEDSLIHHPFKIREASNNIVMNIRNSRQLPVLTPVEKQAQQATLRITFPVSSGSTHRDTESEWTPVEPKPPEPRKEKVGKSFAETSSLALPAPPKEKSIFPNNEEATDFDIGSIISERLQAVRKLQVNPYDVQALTKMHKIQEKSKMWGASKQLPGQFLGSTGVQVLSQAQLSGDRRHQAWAKKTQLTSAEPVKGGIGQLLLQRMGWKEGEGLGKNNTGNVLPLMLDVKVDRKGLKSIVEGNKGGSKMAPGKPQARAKDLSGKHPVSALMELCNKRRWGAPNFQPVNETGPDHQKHFLFKVKVNNIEYQPAVASPNKKLAKAQCAAVCLQEMGLIPRDAPLNI